MVKNPGVSQMAAVEYGGETRRQVMGTEDSGWRSDESRRPAWRVRQPVMRVFVRGSLGIKAGDNVITSLVNRSAALRGAARSGRHYVYMPVGSKMSSASVCCV